jgi:phenylpropionate dioxygenase-like ring-hydroxylating dioxygenase large terminal subunit
MGIKQEYPPLERFMMNSVIPMMSHDQQTSSCSTFPMPTSPTLWDIAGGLVDEWYVACTSTELTTDQALSIKILGRGIAVFRRSNGHAAAIIDQCVHRASLLSAGLLKDGCLTCPYHGWRYDGDGQVVHIPSVDGIHSPSKPHPFKQKSFAVREQDGLVWIYLGEKTPNKEPFKLPFYNRPDFVSYYLIGLYDGDVGAVAQNIMDVSHTVFVHDKVFRSTEGKTLDSTIEVKARAVEILYHDKDAAVGMMPWLTNPHRAPLVHTDKFFAPNITQVDYHWGDASGMVFNSLITPIDEHSSKVYTCVSYKFPLPKSLLLTMKPLVRVYTQFVNNQDMTIMKTRRTGLRSQPFNRQHSVRADMAHIAIEKILSALRERREISVNTLGIRTMKFEI